MVQRKSANALLEEEVKDDERQRRRMQVARTSTNEGSFKIPQAPTTPTRRSLNDSNRMEISDIMNTTVSSGSQFLSMASL